MKAAPAGAWGAVSLALTLCLLLAGCGKKDLPQPPPGVPNTYPQPYPRE